MKTKKLRQNRWRWSSDEESDCYNCWWCCSALLIVFELELFSCTRAVHAILSLQLAFLVAGKKTHFFFNGAEH